LPESNFLDAAGDFAAPLFFGGRVDGIVKAFQQRTGQGGASLGSGGNASAFLRSSETSGVMGVF
jgi:hypothetical protein